ncbi:MAG: hypothetical protein ACPG8W_13870 [Candidatus Promineifilaceae bacterium]
MKRTSRGLLFGIAFLIIFVLVWEKVRIFINISLSLGQALLLFGGAVLALYLVLDHLINRE